MGGLGGCIGWLGEGGVVVLGAAGFIKGHGGFPGGGFRVCGTCGAFKKVGDNLVHFFPGEVHAALVAGYLGVSR